MNMLINNYELYRLNHNDINLLITDKNPPCTVSSLNGRSYFENGMLRSSSETDLNVKYCQSYIKTQVSESSVNLKIKVKNEPYFNIWLEIIEKCFNFSTPYEFNSKKNEYLFYFNSNNKILNYYNFVLLRKFFSNAYVFIVDRMLYHYLTYKNKTSLDKLTEELWSLMTFMYKEQYDYYGFLEKKYPNQIIRLSFLSNVVSTLFNKKKDYYVSGYSINYAYYFGFFSSGSAFNEYYGLLDKKNNFPILNLTKLNNQYKDLIKPQDSTRSLTEFINLNLIFNHKMLFSLEAEKKIMLEILKKSKTIKTFAYLKNTITNFKPDSESLNIFFISNPNFKNRFSIVLEKNKITFITPCNLLTQERIKTKASLCLP